MLGDIIRSLRKQAKLSQEELADGICSAVSISRIENGVQMPSAAVLDKLLEKLGAGTYQICDIYYKNEKQLEFDKSAEQVMRLISQGRLSEAEKNLDALKAFAQDDVLNIQCYTLLTSSIELYEQHDITKIINNLKAALLLTKSNFDFSDFRNTLLSPTEINILNAIVVAMYKNKDTLGAIRLGEELFKALEKHQSNLKEYQISKINLTFNLAQCMEKECRYKEALHYCELTEESSLESTEQMLLPEIEFIKAKIYHRLGRDEECIRIIKAIVPYMELIHKTEFANLVKTYASSQLNITL